MMLRITPGWWQESPITRESTKQAVKTVAQGRPDRSGVPVVTNSCPTFFGREAAGASRIRLSLRPLSSEGLLYSAKLGQTMPRECEGVSCHCESGRDDPSSLALRASPGRSPPKRISAKAEAIQHKRKEELDCFAGARNDDGLFDR
jgi:hypothetical protein